MSLTAMGEMVRPDRMAITEQFDMRRLVGRVHRHDIDLDAVEAIERHLRRAVIDRRTSLAQPVTRIEVPAGRDIADRDRTMVDPHDARALPVGIGARRELQELERVAFGIAELDRRHAARGLWKRYRALSADRRGAGVACPAPCGLRIVRDEREVLEDKVAGGCIAGIWATGHGRSFRDPRGFGRATSRSANRRL